MIAMSKLPERIQLRRTAGWRLPEGAVSVARPTIWGNPFKVGALVEDPESDRFPPLPHTGNLAEGTGGVGHLSGLSYIFNVRKVTSRADAVALFIAWADYQREDGTGLTYRQMCRRDLAGRSLACWCPLDGRACHAEALLRWAAGWRAFTPDVAHADGGNTIHMQRCCNGCRETIGDVSWEEMEAGMNGDPLPDARPECPRCAPLLAVAGG